MNELVKGETEACTLRHLGFPLPIFAKARENIYIGRGVLAFYGAAA